VSSTDGVELAVHDLGGAGPAIIFAHATGLHALVWAPLVHHLTDRFRCWAVDFRGHGDSTPPVGRSLEWAGFADDVLAVVDTLQLDRPFGVGHSKGGASLLLAEERRPGTLRAAYLFEPIVYPVPEELPPGTSRRNELSEGARRRRDVFASRDQAYENYASKPPLSAMHPDALRAYVDHGFADQPDGTVRLKCRPEHEAEVFEMSWQHDAFERLEDVRCPVTVACGGEPGPSLVAPLVAERLPAGRLEVHDDLGHFGPLQDPARIARSIERAFAGE
jgi:pimeloyl-ACP methyl ester carboxylesterase